MNTNFGLNYQSYHDAPLHNSTANNEDDSANPAMDMSAMQNNLNALQSSNPSSKNHSSQYSQLTSGNDGTVDIGRINMMDFGVQQPGSSMAMFNFDPSLSGTLDDASTDMQAQLNAQYQKAASSGPGLSVDTHFANVMNFNPMGSANSNFQSPLDVDYSNQYLNNNGGANMPLDIDMLNESIASMNDLFSNQQFDSPVITSPMTGTFNAAAYTQPQHLTSSLMGDASQLMSTSSTNGPNLQLGTTGTTNVNAQTQARRSSTSKTSSMGPPSASSSSKARGQSIPATIADLTLPWSNPTGGWPSTMDGAKPHMMSTQYRNAYAPSGFDLMQTLYRVVSRPNPEINLGAVDLSCAFVVCDATSHDAPIIYCSESFERLTGYSKYEILGQNCRFLQSPDGRVEAGLKRKYCDDNSILFLKNSIAQQAEAQISLINYRKGGQPFMNLLTMIPVRDEEGEVIQIVGFQVDLVENPHAVNSRNPDGTYSINYQRNNNLPHYQYATPEQTMGAEQGRTITKDEVTTVLHTITSSGDNELSRRMLDKVLLENSDDVIHVLSLKGLFLYLSPSCQRVLEYDPAELTGSALSSICHPSDIVPVTRELKETQTGNAVSVVFRIRRKTSGYVWFESHGSLHTEQGKGRKCIILVGRERPVYTLGKQIIMSAGGIGDHEIWSKMSTTGMFLYVSNHVKGLLDRSQDDLVGTNIQAIMRPETKKEFNRVLQIALTGQSVQVKHELMNRRGMIHQAHTWLYPGDAIEGQKPTFLIAQTRLLKYSNRGGPRQKLETSSVIGSASGLPMSANGSVGSFASTGGTTPTSLEQELYSTTGVVISKAGLSANPIGKQDESLASNENAFEELKTTRSSSWQYELRQLEKKNRILAEEVQQLMVAKKKRKRRRGAGLLQKDCANCHTTNTPEWRRGPSGNRDLCNSCGLRWAKQV